MRKSNGNTMDFSLHHAGMRKKRNEGDYIGPTTGVIARYSTALSGLVSRATSKSQRAHPLKITKDAAPLLLGERCATGHDSPGKRATMDEDVR
jgi:hypothetical protein